jgi:hypothetical protein
VVAREFERWMNETPNTFIEPSMARAGFDDLLRVMTQVGLDVLDPRDTESVLDVIFEIGPDGEAMFDLLHDYVHFRLETAMPGEWDEAHDLIEEALGLDGGVPEVLTAALADAEKLDPALRNQALADVLIVSRVRDLLDWIGAGRAVTSSGALRRSDIAPVAALLGITARGVARLPLDGELLGRTATAGGEVLVQSMWELLPLSAWWEALRAADLIEVTPTRVRRGSAASSWLAKGSLDLERATAVVSVYIAQLLTEALQGDSDAWNDAIVRLTIAEAIAALDPDADVADRTPMEDMLAPRARRTLGHLVDAGLVLSESGERFLVPELLRGPFASGVMLAMSFVAGAIGDAADLDDDRSPFDEPQVKAEMARLGIVHTPGMAAEILSEMAPLLAEEGIDLANLDGENLDAVNAALARATERRNLERFTPVGEQRAMALTVHRLVTEAVAEGSTTVARVVIDGIQPDPVGTMPSVAQVIGVGLGALDEWHRDPEWAQAIAEAQVPEWDLAEMRAARDILRVARGSSAFDQLGALIGRHRGKSVMVGTLLAVAGVVTAFAAHQGLSVRDAVGRVLIED